MRSVNFDCGVFAIELYRCLVLPRRSLFTLDNTYRIELLCRCLAERLNKPPFTVGIPRSRVPQYRTFWNGNTQATIFTQLKSRYAS